MTAQRLARLYEHRVFDPAPLRGHLYELHEPFDHMIGGAADTQWEGALDRALRRGERITVVGASGTGKSSLMEYALGPLVEGLAPIPLPLGLSTREQRMEPAAFAGLVVDRVHRHVRDTLPKLAVGRAPGDVGPAVKGGIKLGLPWMPGAELAAELASVSSPAARTGMADGVAARTLVELIESQDLIPVLVLDDTDTWGRSPGGDVDGELLEAFFSRIPRFLAEDLGCAAVVAIHPSYLALNGYLGARGFLGTEVRVPRLPGVGAVSTLLNRRQLLLAGERDLVDADAATELFTWYGSGRLTNIRALLMVADTALAGAVAAGSDSVQAEHVLLAAGELGW